MPAMLCNACLLAARNAVGRRWEESDLSEQEREGQRRVTTGDEEDWRGWLARRWESLKGGSGGRVGGRWAAAAVSESRRRRTKEMESRWN